MTIINGIGFIVGLSSLGVLCVIYTILRFTASSCSYPELQQDFSIASYSGTWYQFSNVPNSFQSGQCTTATYTLKEGG